MRFKVIEIYTDGAYNPVLGQGGWAAAIVETSQKQAFSGAAEKTTNNRMEITAALEGILHTPQGAELVVYTDSQYLFGCMAKGWKRQKNLDLFEKLDTAVSQRKVRWQWVSGDSGDPIHEEVHTRANHLASLDEVVRPAPSEKQKEKAPTVEELTHIDAQGRPRMVDVTDKPDTQRQAVAKGMVRMQASTFDLLKKGAMAKGDVLGVAQLAGIMAAKQTANLIPLCHPVILGEIKVEFNLDERDNVVEITTTAKSIGKTGVEMEALVANAVAALTIYDMCKAVDRGIQIENIRLIRKRGGKSGEIDLES